jgi:hypothetical protein
MSTFIGCFIVIQASAIFMALVVAVYRFGRKEPGIILTDTVLLLLLVAVLFYASWKLITTGAL